MKRTIILIAVLFLATFCGKEENLPIYDDNGVLLFQKSSWVYSLHDNDEFRSNSFVDFPIIYEKSMLMPTTASDDKLYVSLVTSNNVFKWKWNDLFVNSSKYIDISYAYQHENLLTWQVGGKSYCIDMNTGLTKWKIQRNRSFHSSIFGIDNKYFILGEFSQYPNLEILVGYKGNLQTGEIEEFLIPNFSFEHIIDVRCCDVAEIEPVVLDGVLHLAVIYQELTSSEIWNFQSYFGLYNMETEDWVYDRKIMNEPRLNGVSMSPPSIHNGKFYANIGHEIACHSIATGEQLWLRAFPNDFMFSGFIIEDGMLIALCEDGKLYRLNPETGGVVWTGEGAGTSSRMSYMNGVVYFVGGSTGKLHAVDAYTGETVWRLDAELIEGSNAEFRTNAVYVIPGQGNEKGKVVALTHMHAYCFEAYR